MSNATGAITLLAESARQPTTNATVDRFISSSPKVVRSDGGTAMHAARATRMAAEVAEGAGAQRREEGAVGRAHRVRDLHREAAVREVRGQKLQRGPSITVVGSGESSIQPV